MNSEVRESEKRECRVWKIEAGKIRKRETERDATEQS